MNLSAIIRYDQVVDRARIEGMKATKIWCIKIFVYKELK